MNNKDTVATAGQLIRSAKARGVKPLRDETGRRYYQLEDVDGALQVAGVQVPSKEKREHSKVYELARKMQAKGVKPFVDENGSEYYSFVYDAENGTAHIETPDEDTMRKARSVSPGKG